MRIIGKIQDWVITASGGTEGLLLDFLTDESGNFLSDESGNIFTLNL